MIHSDDGQNKYASDGNFLDGDFGFVNTEVRIENHKLTTKKIKNLFQRLSRFHFWRSRGFRFRLRLNMRLKIVIFGRKKLELINL